MSCPLIFCWITILLLSTVVPVTGKIKVTQFYNKSSTILFLIEDSCSSAFGIRKPKRMIITEPDTTEPPAKTNLSTTMNLTSTIMTEIEERKTTATSDVKQKKEDKYHIYQLCTDLYASDYCLNGGTCYTHEKPKIYLCECAHPFTGARCEEKMFEGSYGGGMVRKSRSPRRSRPRRTSRMLNLMFSCLLCLVVNFVVSLLLLSVKFCGFSCSDRHRSASSHFRSKRKAKSKKKETSKTTTNFFNIVTLKAFR